MFSNFTYTLSKSLPQFVMPMGIALVLLIFAVFIANRKPRLSRSCVCAALGLLIIFSLPVTSNLLISNLENLYPAVSPAEASKVDAIVLLGGGLAPELPPRQYWQLGSGADRLLLTHKLYLAGKAKHVFLIGGDPYNNKPSEAEETRDILVSWGIPAEAMILDTNSINTEENAQNTSKLFEEHNIRTSVLVTSANHMPRAMALFRKHDIDISAMPADHWIARNANFNIKDWIPNATNLAGSTQALREYLGILYYLVSDRVQWEDVFPTEKDGNQGAIMQSQ